MMDPYDACTWAPPRQLAPGVMGVTIDRPDGFYLCAIVADVPGLGDGGRYLDSLPRDRRVVVPLVLSAKLAGMLLRRGFTELHDDMDTFAREATL